jgi:SAM-dependent methyltransferase
MIEKTEDVMSFLDGLSVASWTATAIGVLFEGGIVDALSEPRTAKELETLCRGLSAGQIARCLDIAVANDLAARDGERYRLAPAMLPLRDRPLRSIVPANLRSGLMQGLAFLDAADGDRPRVGWQHEDARILRGQGEGSVMLVRMMKQGIVPNLEGLAERFASSDARFLDVGVGVGALSVEMCRAFPKLTAVGLDVHEPALAIARENVASAQMNDRVELRKIMVEDLGDEAVFDFAWLPSFFMRNTRAAAARICTALRPGGWVLCALVGAGGNAKQNAAWALAGELWGGEQLTPAEAAETLRVAGFSTVRELRTPAPGIAFVAARR